MELKCLGNIMYLLQERILQTCNYVLKPQNKHTNKQNKYQATSREILKPFLSTAFILKRSTFKISPFKIGTSFTYKQIGGHFAKISHQNVYHESVRIQAE